MIKKVKDIKVLWTNIGKDMPKVNIKLKVP